MRAARSLAGKQLFGIVPARGLTFAENKNANRLGLAFFSLSFKEIFLVANRGIEPRTRGFSIRCSTN